MRRQIGVGLAALIAGWLAVPAAQAAPAPGRLVLAGHGSGYVDLTFTRPVTVTPRVLDSRSAGWSATGCGSYRGFYLRPLSGDPMLGLGAVDYPSFDYRPGVRLALPLGRKPLSGGGPNFQVPAGRFRAHLLAEPGVACEVRILIAGLSGTVRRTTTGKTTVQAATRPVSPMPVPSGPPVGATSFDLTINPSTLILSLVHSTERAEPHTRTGTFVACVDPAPGPACTNSDGANSKAGYFVSDQIVYTSSVDASYVTDYVVWYAPSVLAAGQTTAKTAALGPFLTSANGALFALDL